MSKRNRKRLLSVLLTAALIFTLAISSVMAQDEEHVRADKLSVGVEAAEDEETGVGSLDEEEVTPDEATEEETVSVDKINGAWSSEEDAAEADADPVEKEPESGIQTLAAEDPGDDEYGIMPLADTLVASSDGNMYESVYAAVQAAPSNETTTITLTGDSNETSEIHISNGQDIVFDLAGHTLSGNNSERIFYVAGESKLTINDSSATDAEGTNGTGVITGGRYSSGPAIYITNASGTPEVTLNGGTITGNRATGGDSDITNYGGGAVYSSGTFIMNGGVITGNSAAGYNGGAVDTHGTNGTFEMNGGIISDNKAALGGGVCVYGSTFVMNGGTISGNTASDGGGVALYRSLTYSSGMSFTMTGGSITGNTASGGSKGGAGVAVTVNESDPETNVITMTGGSISENKGDSEQGGGIYAEYATLNLEGGEISGNETDGKSGAGIYAYLGCVVNMSDGVTISQNSAYSNDGGGVCVFGSTFNMTGGTISGNSAKSAGGVQIYGNRDSADYPSTFNMSGGTITGNAADKNGGTDSTDGEGGGVQIKKSTSSVTCIFNMTGGEITGNTAVTAGGGVGFSSGTVNIGGTATISGNAMTTGATDNVHLYSGSMISLLGDDDEMSGGNVGVNTAVDPTEDKPVQITTTENGTELYAAAAKYFSSDDTAYGVRGNDAGYLELYVKSFEDIYLTGEDGNLYTEANADNYLQIIDGESDWDAMTQDEKDAVNANLAANGSPSYEELLAQAKALKAAADQFVEDYLTGEDGSIYTEANEDNYQQILAGEDEWDAMTQDEKDAVNATLAANGSPTYEELLAQAQALADEAAADKFVADYLTGDDGGIYTEANADNYLQILAGEDEWNAMTQDAKDAVNATLAANGSPTYEELLAQAKALGDEVTGFEEKYLTGSDGNLYIEVNAENYAQILAGEADWNALSDEAKAAINADLTAAWQAAGHDGELTYPMLLQWAKDLAAQLESTGAVKTGDNSRLYPYLLLIAAAGAAASGAVVVSRRRV